MAKGLFLIFILVPVFSFSKYRCNYHNFIKRSYPIKFSLEQEGFSKKEIRFLKKAMSFWNTRLEEEVLILGEGSGNIIRKEQKDVSKSAEAYFGYPEITIIFYKGKYRKEDFYKISIHEFGHALGLDHDSSSESIMFAGYIGGNKLSVKKEIYCLKKGKRK